MGEGMGVGQVVDRADLCDLLLGHRAQDIAPDAAEAVDAEICHKKIKDWWLNCAPAGGAGTNL